MNVQCTHCSTVFRVDPRKVPAGGVRVRCSICRGVFEVAGDGAQAAEPAAAATSAAPAAGPAFQPVSTPAPTPAPAATPAPAPRPAPAAPAASTPARSPFGVADPNAKARRLARALVSDIVTYHPERRDKALADGTLKREFMEEIKKSWEEYVGQVGAETARGTTHFRDALNEILAKGQSLF
jgi:predicted Zn finger-like uncharacterized protein